MKVVVTGGAGFIGANLCRHLLADGVDEVVALDDLSTGFAANLDGVDAALVEGDIGDPDVLDAVLPGAASVVHLGARPSVPRSLEDPLASHHANATGTLQVLEGVRRHGVPHVVVASSSSVYGRNPTLPKHEGLTPMPVSPYAVSKLATEAYALSHAASLRDRRAGLPVLQRVRAAAGRRPRLRGGRARVRVGRPGREAGHGARRRRADPGLHLRRVGVRGGRARPCAIRRSAIGR